MTRKLLSSFAIAALFAAGIAGKAQADWQYARWGMSPDQLVAAAGGAVRLGPPPQGKTYDNLTGRALGTYQGDGATFDAYFHFDNANGLAKVALERTGGTDCATLHNTLTAQHGKPATSHRQSFATIEAWNDTARRNIVRYVQVGELPCTITYEPLR